VSSDRSAGPIRDDFGIVGRALTQSAMRSVRVVMLDVLGEEMFELLAVPDRVRSQTSRRTLPTHRSAYAFATGVEGAVRIMVVPSLRKTSRMRR
jgi:hypothetical protein